MQDNELQRVPEDAELDAMDANLRACCYGKDHSVDKDNFCKIADAITSLRRRVGEMEMLKMPTDTELVDQVQSCNEKIVELEADRERLWEFARDHCPSCDGVGYFSAPAHHPSCDGSCSQCPIEKQMQCDCEGVIRSYMDTLSGLKIDAARANEEKPKP